MTLTTIAIPIPMMIRRGPAFEYILDQTFRDSGQRIPILVMLMTEQFLYLR